jgi:hypothetical protein
MDEIAQRVPPRLRPLFPPSLGGKAVSVGDYREAVDAYRELLTKTRLNQLLVFARRIGTLEKLAKRFKRKWGLWFPVPPAFGGVIPRVLPLHDGKVRIGVAHKLVRQAVPHSSPDRFMRTPITNPIREIKWTPENLTLDIWLPAGKIVLDFIGGRLDHFQPHRHDLVDASKRPDSGRTARVSRKPGASRVVLQGRPANWLRLHIENPAGVDLSKIRQLLGPHLVRSPISFQKQSAIYFGQIFAAIRERHRLMTARQRDLCGRHEVEGWLTREDLAAGLALSGDRTQISALRKRYRALCRTFGLPPL